MRGGDMLPTWLRPLLLLLGGMALLGEEAIMREEPRTMIIVTAWIMLGLVPVDTVLQVLGWRRDHGDDK